MRIAPYRSNEVRLSLRLPADLHAALHERAARQDVSFNVYVNQILLMHVAPIEREPKVTK